MSMKHVLSITAIGLALASLSEARATTLATVDGENWRKHHHHGHHKHHHKHHKHHQPASEAEAHAQNAHEAASVAKQAAVVADAVAKHSVKVTGHAQEALKHALGALHDARIEANTDKSQAETLKKAEANLRDATDNDMQGKSRKIKVEYDLQKTKKEKMKSDLRKTKSGKTEKEELRQEIQRLRNELKEKNVKDKDISAALDELEAELDKSDGSSNDEIKAELERLREQIDKLEAEPRDKPDAATPDKTAPRGLQNVTAEEDEPKESDEPEEAVTPIQEKGIDIDTQMPYGDLEPFGREDTAQELTEGSIRESDEMVDQLERAEVAEEKRAVFRALTRLRGAAITSFDGVARSQTGNIDEYNQVHKWRKTHPLHHLADEESDVSKWAFPDNAD